MQRSACSAERTTVARRLQIRTSCCISGQCVMAWALLIITTFRSSFLLCTQRGTQRLRFRWEQSGQPLARYRLLSCPASSGGGYGTLQVAVTGGKAFAHDVIANGPSGTSPGVIRIQRDNDGEHGTFWNHRIIYPANKAQSLFELAARAMKRQKPMRARE